MLDVDAGGLLVVPLEEKEHFRGTEDILLIKRKKYENHIAWQMDGPVRFFLSGH